MLPLMTHRLLLSFAGLLLSTAVLGSCGDSVGNDAATDLVLIRGNGQVAIIDDTLPVPLSIRAVNQAGAGAWPACQCSGRLQPAAWSSQTPSLTRRATPWRFGSSALSSARKP